MIMININIIVVILIKRGLFIEGVFQNDQLPIYQLQLTSINLPLSDNVILHVVVRILGGCGITLLFSKFKSVVR